MVILLVPVFLYIYIYVIVMCDTVNCTDVFYK